MAEEHKAIPVSSSQLIKVGGTDYTSFANMNSVNDLASVEMAAPAFHRRYVDALKASGKVRDDTLIAPRSVAVLPQQAKGFKRGVSVVTTEGKKVTIIQASAGYTKRSNTPVHRVADKKGNSWLEKETDLTIR